MNRLLFIVVSAVFFFFNADAQNTAMTTRSLNGVTGYTTITVGQGIDLVFDEKYRDSIRLVAPSLVIDRLTLNVKATTVNAAYRSVKKDDLKVMPHATIYLSPAFVQKITTSGDSNITFRSRLTSSQLHLTTMGQSKIDGELNVSHLVVRLSKNTVMNCLMTCVQSEISLKEYAKFIAKQGSKCSILNVSCLNNSVFDGKCINDLMSLKCSCNASAKAFVKSSGEVALSSTDYANISANVDCNRLTVRMNKDSKVNVNGVCRLLVLNNADHCTFSPKKFEVETLAKLNLNGTSNSVIACKGGVDVKAVKQASAKILRCGGQLAIHASDNASVSYPKGTRVSSMIIKDHATTKTFSSSKK